MFHTDDEFLREIERQPAERTVRLVYADWLDERDDPRGELIRVEEEMRTVPVYSDRFWELKPRRNVLREKAGSEWCGRMRYGTECEPVFRHGIPDGWRERWRLIREYTERWHRIPMLDIGGRQTEIAEAEARLGLTLPPSVREWVAFAFDVRPSPDSLDVLRDVYHLEPVPGHPAIFLLSLAERDYRWAVRLVDFTRADPPVRGFRLDYEGNPLDETFVPDDDQDPVTDTVTRFVIDYVMAYTRGDGGGFNADVREREPLIRDLARTFPTHARWGDVDYFESDNIWIRVGPSMWGVDDELRITVELDRPVPPDRIPVCLWDQTRHGGSFHGMFVTRRND